MVATWSALSFRGRTICYRLQPTERPDTFIVSARELGCSEPFPVTDELRQAITVELERQAAKQHAP